MARWSTAHKLVIELPDGNTQLLEPVLADHEFQLQERLKRQPELLPLEELGLAAPTVVVGRESSLDSGRVDLVLMGNGGDLALVEFKTGPQNPDFRECLAQLLDYGSDLRGAGQLGGAYGAAARPAVARSGDHDQPVLPMTLLRSPAWRRGPPGEPDVRQPATTSPLTCSVLAAVSTMSGAGRPGGAAGASAYRASKFGLTGLT